MPKLNVLDVKLDPATNDAGASSVREYLKRLLADLWEDGEGFNGKRPFGNSGWEYELLDPIIEAGLATDHTSAKLRVMIAITNLN